jgi:hypothetical protein
MVDDTCVYSTEKHERRVLNKLQRGLTAVGSWCQRWNIKINEGKTQAIYFSKRRRMPGDELLLNGRNIPFVNSVKYLGVIFDRRMAWRLHIEKPAAKALDTYIRTYMSADIKLIVYRSLIRSIMTYVCPTWEFAADIHLIKLQRLQKKVFRAIGNLDRRTRSAFCIWSLEFRSVRLHNQIMQLTGRSYPERRTSKCTCIWTRISQA